MRFKLCSRGLGINLDGKHIHIVEVRISLQLEARLTRFLQDEIESIAQMRYEDLPGFDSVVFLDVPAVSLTILLPNLPPCPTLYPHPHNIRLHLHWLLHTLYPANSSSQSTICLSHPSSQSVAFSSFSSSSSPPPPSASQPLDSVYPSSKSLKAAYALLHLWFMPVWTRWG